MKKIVIICTIFVLSFNGAFAQEIDTADTESQSPTTESTSSTTVGLQNSIKVMIAPDTVIFPENAPQVKRIRNVETLTVFNVVPYLIFRIIELGLPAETVILILMIPIFTTMLVFARNIVGLPSLDMLVIIALAIALLASNIIIGTLLLVTILFASMSARVLLKKVKIMQLPKISLSMILVSFSVLLLLSILAFSGLVSVESVSIVPILLLIILSERIVRLEFERKPKQVWLLVISSLFLGLVGYYLLLSDLMRAIVLNFPEVILFMIPLNFFMGRYFGLRLTEYSRFSEIMKEVLVKKK